MKFIGRMLSLILVASVVYIAWSHRSTDAPPRVVAPPPVSSAPASTTVPVVAAPIERGMATASPVPPPSSTPAPIVPSVTIAIPLSRQLARNEQVSAGKDTVIAGDVQVDGQPLFANDARVGLVVILERDARVLAPYGATLTALPDHASAVAKAQSIAADMHRNGCNDNGGCAAVRIVSFPSRETVAA